MRGASVPLDPLEVTQNPLALGCDRQVTNKSATRSYVTYLLTAATRGRRPAKRRRAVACSMAAGDCSAKSGSGRSPTVTGLER